MAERNGALLRRWLRSAERLSDLATARGEPLVKTPRSRSSALLVRMTCADQRLPRFAIRGAEQCLCLNGGPVALLLPQGGADRGDQLLGVDRLVDAADEFCLRQALALELPECGTIERSRVALVAALEL